jgi:phasin family protein
MTEKTEFEAAASAAKAYAAAAEAVTPKPTPVVAPAVTASQPEPEPEVEFPSKAKRAAKPKPAAAVAAKPVAAPVAKAAPLKAAVVRRAAVKATPTKVVPAKAAIKPKPVAVAKISAPKIIAPKASAPKTVAQKTLFQQLKDKTVSTTDFTTKIKSAVGEAQAKAKEAFDKGAATFGEYNEFSKGNVEAVVASGKIIAAGVQSLGKTFVDDGKSAFETLTAEVKELASVKSPVDFFKLQAEFLRRNFDIAVANTSKNSEAVLKLASEAAAPISARVNLAVEKVKQAA